MTGGGQIPPVQQQDDEITFSSIALSCIKYLLKQTVVPERCRIQSVVFIVLIILFVETVLYLLVARLQRRRNNNSPNLLEPPYVPRFGTRNGPRFAQSLGLRVDTPRGARLGQRVDQRIRARIGLPAFQDTLDDHIRELHNLDRQD